MSQKLEGQAGIQQLGHRGYVGGLWEQIGRLQFDFMLEQGLKPEHYLLDIACGALRGGIHFIHYLEPGHYFGLDKEAELIRLGIVKELGQSVADHKQPQFIVSDQFEFNGFKHKPDYSMAQSLFTHLNPADIQLCLSHLADWVDSGHRFYATFFEGDSGQNPKKSHSHAGFLYSQDEMRRFGQSFGWQMHYIGDWHHPRRQRMLLYIKT